MNASIIFCSCGWVLIPWGQSSRHNTYYINKIGDQRRVSLCHLSRAFHLFFDSLPCGGARKEAAPKK
jgi:hypothetical protein